MVICSLCFIGTTRSIVFTMKHKTNQSDDEQLVTKGMLRRELQRELQATRHQIVEEVSTVTGTIIADALQLIAERFDDHDRKFEQVFVSLNRIENKLDATVDRVDDHESRL